MPQAPETLDGWYSLHLFYAIDWTTLRLLPSEERQAMVDELQSFLTTHEAARTNNVATMRFIILLVKKQTYYYGYYALN